MMGAIAALMFDNVSGTTNKITHSTINTSLMLAFSLGGFMHIAMVSILPVLVQEKNPKDACVNILLILLGISAMSLM